MGTTQRRGRMMEVDQPSPPGGNSRVPVVSGDSFPLCDSQSTKFGCVPLAQWGFFSLCWMTQIKIPSFVCCNSLWFFPNTFLRSDNTPAALCLRDRRDETGLCRGSSTPPGAEAPGLQTVFPRRGVELLPAPGPQLSVCLLGRSES